jgi:hypothetical protein
MIMLLITNVKINCSENNNLKILDGLNNLYDYCASNDENQISFSSLSQWIALMKNGVVSFDFQLDYIEICGNPTIKPILVSSRIVGGHEVRPNSWPWQVLVTDGYYMCGAILLNNQVIKFS